MARTTRIPKAQITGPYGYVLTRMMKRMFGEVLEPVEVMWHHRKVLRDTLMTGRKAQKWDRVEPSLKSFAHMAAVARVGCSFCLDFGYFHAQNEGLDLRKASEVPRWRVSDAFTSLERDVMEYAEGMTETPTRVTDELSARLLDQLGTDGVVELTAWIAFANMTARANTALGVESQGLSKACAIPLADPVPA